MGQASGELADEEHVEVRDKGIEGEHGSSAQYF